jgi:phosphate/sulfate permease
MAGLVVSLIIVGFMGWAIAGFLSRLIRRHLRERDPGVRQGFEPIMKPRNDNQ